MENMESGSFRESKGYIVVEQAPDGSRHILYADKAACTVTRLAAEQLQGADPSGVTAELAVERVKLDSQHELWILEPSGGRQQHVAELERMNSALEAALKSAESANRAKSSFLSSMSHDIRTPMNAIVGMTSIGLSHIDEKPRVQDCLLKIRTASTHLMSLVNDVLDMSRIDSGRMKLNEEAFSLAELIHDIAVMMRPQAVQKKQELQIEIGRIYEESLIGDSLRLRQILVNIIGNAVKYTMDEGAIHVHFSQRRTEPAVQEEGGGVVWLDFVCEDNGIGMSREFLERIFIPFERVSNAVTSKIEGTGLGMAIVKNLIDQMGGRITVESREGEGSRFRVELPLLSAPQGKQPAELPAGQTVLVAESWSGRIGQIMDYLQEGGLIPVHVQSGMDAVTWLTEVQYEGCMPCAMLLGQELTDMTVLELASHVRQLAGRDFPILLVSEQDWAHIEYRAVRAGVSAFVPCPLFKSRLLGTLAGLLGSGGGEETAAGGQDDFSRLHVLLVEDNEMNQEIAMELLSMIGVQVEVADNGALAVEAFQASEEGHFDLIFMDVQMPVMNGYEATSNIRRLQRGDAQSVWIVAMTANAFVEDVRLSKEAGMNEHCSKPIDPERLQEILRGRLAVQERSAGKQPGDFGDREAGRGSTGP